MMPSGGAVTQPVRQTNRWDATSSAASPAARPRRMTGRPLDQSLPHSDIVTPITYTPRKTFPEPYKASDQSDQKQYIARRLHPPLLNQVQNVRQKNYNPA